MGGYVGPAPVGFPNVALAQLAKEFNDDQVPLVGDLICPNVPVERQSFPYLVWDRSNLKLPDTTLRAPGDSGQLIRRSFSEDTYFCRSHALETNIPFESEAYAAGLGFSERAHATKDLIGRIRLKREAEIATLALSAQNFPNNLTLAGTDMWDAYITNPATDTSNPLVDVENAKEQLRRAAVPDKLMVLVLSSPLVKVLVNHPVIVERFKYTNTMGIVDIDKLSSVFGVTCVKAAAQIATLNGELQWVWGNDAFLGYAQKTPSREDVSCMKTFTWAGGKGPGPNGTPMDYPGAPGTVDGYGVLEWIDPHLSKKTYWQSVDWYYDTKVTAQETGFPILNAVSGDSALYLPNQIEG
ncbi:MULTISPECIES: hypothetical protein [Acidobacterium]|uniref:Conserved domain protein n=1 Tax=Acidobacterium capsulatum (strain ATCC 51196 / DSM 11244 / BCRC 80197 / JCM 7670 / NBRC 15755 / NCIMB 13165 / 161) TaxID=240015 RepID=C1FA24_ACIC5|nr:MULTISPECIES: hypothetical protein [Acidobacterium]ACO34047.1 conserved domain protein [Acidobacterium capsulatum ATCC 51196]HCT62052.1 hypothetical protein [Acidobacterium sp.]